MNRLSRLLLVCSIVVSSRADLVLQAAQPTKLKLTHPLAYQVFQREGYEPKNSAANTLGGPQNGFTDVTIGGEISQALKGTWEYRLTLKKNGYGRSHDWMPLQVESDDREFRGLAEIPSGGWYGLDVRCVDDNGKALAEGTVEAIGVGEVFLVAGQSYAGGHNDEVMNVTDPSQAVSTYDWNTKSWRVAHDPPPENGKGGSIWPPLGDMLVSTLRVPIAFVNVSVGGTSTAKWEPKGTLHNRMIEVGKHVGSFRAVLWQQGESDVIEKTPIATYVKNMYDIRDAAWDGWGFEPPWILAKSTLHPTVYNNPIEEDRIRRAIDQLWSSPGFRRGPDTDVLGDENRGDSKSKRHFSPIGQRRAALLWFAILWNELQLVEEPN